MASLDRKGKGYPFVETFFDGKNSYVIPNYQRNFEWNVESVDALFDDILETKVPLYIGHLLIKFGLSRDDGESAYNVCDGNQRMTIFFLILASLKRLKLLSDEDTKKITNMIQYSKKRWRLKLNESDQRLFVKLLDKPISEGNYTPEERRKLLYQVYVRIEQRLKGLSTRDVELLWKNLCECTCTFYSLNKDDDEHDIFAKINAEKKALSEYTMIRQYLLNVDDADFNGIHQYISEMDSYIESVDKALNPNNEKKLGDIKNEFISYYVKIARCGRINESRHDDYKYYHAYKSHLENNNIDKTVAAEEICKYAKIYRDIKIAIKGNTKIRGVDIYGVAQAVKIKACIPLLMRMLYEKYEVPKTPITDKDIKTVMSYLTSYLVRGKFLGYRAKGEVQDRLMYDGISDSIADSIKGNGSVSKCFIQKCKNSLVDYPMPTDTEVIDAIVNDNQIGNSNNEFVKYVLTVVENHICDEPIDTKDCHLDHILADKPSKEDLKSYGWTEEVHMDNVYRLGNLSLLTAKKNGSGKKSNKMGRISEYYRESRLKINDYVKANADTWDVSNIEARTRELAGYVIEAFPEL